MLYAIAYVRAWLAQWHPRWRRAQAKRRLEALLQREGMSKSRACRVAGEFYR